MKTIDLINHQYIDNKFNRVDIVVRYMYVKEYSEGSSEYEATDLYSLMLKKRGVEKYDSVENYILKFNKTIDSINKIGFDKNFPIDVNKENLLWDGSHRISIAHCLNIKNISVNYVNPPRVGLWGMNWFVNNEFSTDYLKQIDDCYTKYFLIK